MAMHSVLPTSFFLRATSLARRVAFTSRAVHTTPAGWEKDIPPPPRLDIIENAIQSLEAKSWISRLSTRIIPKDFVKFSYSRSSGPGGQNVNKVNTKATLRCSIDEPWIPRWAHEHIKKTPSYVASSDSILITSTMTRSQAQNTKDCLQKLHSLIVSTASAELIEMVSPEKKARMLKFERIEKEERRRDKDKQSVVKRSRSGRDRDWD